MCVILCQQWDYEIVRDLGELQLRLKSNSVGGGINERNEKL